MTPAPGTVLAALALTAFLLAVTPAQAVYIETPLRLTVDEHAEVGDDVGLTVDAYNETSRRAFAGTQVGVGYSFDGSERADGPDTPTSDAQQTERVLFERLVLDDEAQATFRWTVPAEVADRNVHLFLFDGDGDQLAFAHIAIGDAPPMMHLMNGPAETDDATDKEDAPRSEEATALAPLAGIAALAALVAIGRIRRG